MRIFKLDMMTVHARYEVVRKPHIGPELQGMVHEQLLGELDVPLRVRVRNRIRRDLEGRYG